MRLRYRQSRERKKQCVSSIVPCVRFLRRFRERKKGGERGDKCLKREEDRGEGKSRRPRGELKDAGGWAFGAR